MRLARWLEDETVSAHDIESVSARERHTTNTFEMQAARVSISARACLAGKVRKKIKPLTILQHPARRSRPTHKRLTQSVFAPASPGFAIQRAFALTQAEE